MPVFGLYGLFAITATFYSMVGFGGGSTYIALLGLFGVHYTLIPVISLLCNICVVTHNIQRYRKDYQINTSILWPLLFTSIPFAFIGGQYEINEAFPDQCGIRGQVRDGYYPSNIALRGKLDTFSISKKTTSSLPSQLANQILRRIRWERHNINGPLKTLSYC